MPMNSVAYCLFAWHHAMNNGAIPTWFTEDIGAQPQKAKGGGV